MKSHRQSDALPLNLLALLCLWRRFASSYCCQQSLFSVDDIKEHTRTVAARWGRNEREVKESARSVISFPDEKESLQTIWARVCYSVPQLKANCVFI